MGGYVDNNLGPGERVVQETRYHWIVYCFPRSIMTLGLLPWLERLSSEFAITNKRIIIKTGLILRRTVELNLQQVESVKVDQSIFGRLLDYGTVTIVGSGGTREVFPHIRQPLMFKRASQDQL